MSPAQPADAAPDRPDAPGRGSAVGGMATSTLTIVRDEATLLALGPAWDALEVRALAVGQPARLFESHRYVRLAWQHLRAPGDRLHIVALGDGGGLLRAVWPLVRRRERAMGLPIDVLRPIGIWQGERPGVLCDAPDAAGVDAAWSALWQGLVQGRADWQVLHLRELDAGSWPLRTLPEAAAAAAGLRVQVEPDHLTPWQPLGGAAASRSPGAATGPDRVAASPDWPTHIGRRPEAVRQALEQQQAELSRRAPGARRGVAETPAAVDAAFTRYLAIDATAPDRPGVYRLAREPARVAFYRDFLAAQAERGEVRIETLEADGVDLAATVRLRCGGVWLERAATERADWADAAPALALLLAGLADGLIKRGPAGGAHESNLLLPPDATGRVDAAGAWYDARRATSQLVVWNLRSRMAVVALLRRLLRR